MKKLYIVLLVYALVIVLSVFYFVSMQHFGLKGMSFHIGGRDQIFNLLEILIFLVAVASLFLLVLSFIAFKRTNDTRILILSMAFFFFTVNAFLAVFENFFPGEFIYIGHASKILDLLILASFIMLMYSSYKRSAVAVKKARRK